jgi:hypothetical protein
MPQMKIFRDAAGGIINIGDWDYRVTRVQVTVEVEDKETGESSRQPVFDQLPDGSFVPRTQQVFANPLPEGAYEDEADIVTGWDGGLYEASDPRRLDKA